MAVTTEHRGAVTTIILDRLERRNAIDSPTAKALRAAFRTAERIGLANRVVPRGRAREEAEALARTIAEFPPHCVLSDRRSAYDSLGKTLDAALRREHALGAATMKTGESLAGAQRFAGGAGRHG